jgi:ATP sulfurylase
LHISGTGAREMLVACQVPPIWYMREEISTLIIGEIREGNEVFIK